MKRQELLRIPEQMTPEREDGKVLARAQVVDGILNLDLFYCGSLRARYFADGESYITYREGKWESGRIEHIACEIKEIDDEYWYCSSGQWEYESPESRTIAEEYCGGNVRYWEESIREDKKKAEAQRRKERIAEYMKIVPALPEDLEGWERTAVFPEEYLLNAGKERVCTACQKKSKKINLKGARQVQCQNCGANLQVSKAKSVRKWAHTCILQKISETQWIERQFYLIADWTETGKQIKRYEEIRKIMPIGKRYGEVWYNQGDGYEKGPVTARFSTAYLYPGELGEILQANGLEHTGLMEIAEGGEPIHVNNIIEGPKKPWMEYLIKVGLYTLAREESEFAYTTMIQNKKARTASELLGVPKIEINRLRMIDGSTRELSWMRHASQKGERISDETLRKIQKNRIGFNTTLDACMTVTGLSIEKTINYVLKQKKTRDLFLWSDYLNMAARRGMDLHDDIVARPKDLRRRHDELTMLINREKNKKHDEEYDAKILQYLPEAARYYWEDDTYMIIPAGTCEELRAEGRALHHCVGASDTYMRRMATGESWILFLRQKEDLGKPYYTIEIEMATDRIRQWYSEFDRKPDEKEIQHVLSTFRESIRRTA